MKKTYAAVLAISMAILCAGGCQEEQASPDIKQSRLMAAENRDLKTQLQQETKKKDEEIKKLKTQLQTETKKQKEQSETEKEKLNADVDNLSKQLAECVQEKQAMQDKAEQDIEKLSGELSEGVVTPILNDMEKLKAENARLKEELANCEKKK